MKGLGERFPDFILDAVTGSKGEVKKINSKSYPDHWLVVFFWPFDFTFVCPTEISEFSDKEGEFTKRNTKVLGVSADSAWSHSTWKNIDPNMGKITFPMLSDFNKTLSSDLGILNVDGAPERATYIVDRDMIIRNVVVYDRNVGRNVDETIRVLDALQNGNLCPVNWKKGDSTL
ncbi:peroxiredoxin [Candidatus Nesciobacter abundans]|uniref:Alkyl hydroperoxide reductase C n=1 Tax=Candidatus Nesciobacter abundans TaxID=2601668 RepID=A0A5C0UFL0_9PROT|nr:peroxiredoxin [Candidatus Nesciobacter abundans]QEK38848.1 peroxiredoxin [Candidatus Nesciobacter abundans]